MDVILEGSELKVMKVFSISLYNLPTDCRVKPCWGGSIAFLVTVMVET